MLDVSVIVILVWLCVLTAFMMSEFKYINKIVDLQGMMIDNLTRIDQLTDEEIKSLRDAVIKLYDELAKIDNEDIDENLEDDGK